jgi:hypothetical protein
MRARIGRREAKTLAHEIIEAKWTLSHVTTDLPERKKLLLEESLAEADDLELRTLAWRIRADLADLHRSAGNLADEARRRREAWQSVTAIAELIEDEDLKSTFLKSSQVARVLPE